MFWRYYIFFTPLLSIHVLFLGYRAILDIAAPQLNFCHASTAARSRLLQSSGDAKKMVRIYCGLTILQLFHSPFFRSNCYFRANARNVISQPTDGFFPRHRHRPLALITTKRWRKKNGEKAPHIGDFSVVSLTVISIKLLFLGLSRVPWKCSRQMDFHPAANATGSRSSVKNRNAKRTMRKCYEVSKLHCFSLIIILSITMQPSPRWIS